MAHDFQNELRFLGIESSPAFVRAAEGNGCAERFIRTLRTLHSHAANASFARCERFIRTLKENLPWLRTFASVEELRRALLAFRETYNNTWLIERHGFRPPAAARHEQLSAAALAA